MVWRLGYSALLALFGVFVLTCMGVLDGNLWWYLVAALASIVVAVSGMLWLLALLLVMFCAVLGRIAAIVHLPLVWVAPGLYAAGIGMLAAAIIAHIIATAMDSAAREH